MTYFKTLTSLATVSLFAMSAAAQADDWYLGGSIGYNNTSNQTSTGPNRLVEIEYDDGLVLTGTIGKRFDNNFRIEGEYSWRKNDGESLAFNGVDRGFVADGTKSSSLLLNALYDIDTGSAITPYIGAGAGISFIGHEFFYGPVDFDDNDTSFAWQGIVGATYPINDKAEVFIDGRYFSATGVNLVRTSPMDTGISLDSEYDNFSISVGYRWNFK